MEEEIQLYSNETAREMLKEHRMRYNKLINFSYFLAIITLISLIYASVLTFIFFTYQVEYVEEYEVIEQSIEGDNTSINNVNGDNNSVTHTMGGID